MCISDGGVCEGGDEEERTTGAGCDRPTVDLPDERRGVEQEGGAGDGAGAQTPQSRSQRTPAGHVSVINAPHSHTTQPIAYFFHEIQKVVPVTPS